MSGVQDPDCDYMGVTLNRDENGRVVLAFGSVLAKKGDTVRFRGAGGWDYELRNASARFKTGDAATVERVRVGLTSSRYIFAGIPGDWNTVMFERVESSPTDGAAPDPTKFRTPKSSPAKEP